MAECRWEWCVPDKLGVWWFGGTRKALDPDNRRNLRFIATQEDLDDKLEGWWAFTDTQLPEPLPKRKVTQTLWMVQSALVTDEFGRPAFFMSWLSPDDTIPPRAIETVQKREVEL